MILLPEIRNGMIATQTLICTIFPHPEPWKIRESNSLSSLHARYVVPPTAKIPKKNLNLLCQTKHPTNLVEDRCDPYKM